MLAIAQADRRLALRHLVQRPAECRRNGRLLAGTVRDQNEYGVFFALDRKSDTREPIFLPYQPQIGDLVVLLFNESDDQQLTVATVRWRGIHYEHRCEGLGLQFEDF
ncbi:MAG: PilZ domain-containing protein [Deltaproteobacteria bacterium]|nr:PilZ domain-containing protein [Deltaproteobacteria bacterium]